MVGVNNLTKAKISPSLLKRVAEKVLKKEKSKLAELSVVLVGRKRMQQLNGKYRKKDRATDVLSFSYGRSGEIVLCPEEIKANALKFKSSFKKETVRVLVHGLLHVLNYTHSGMRAKEKIYLSQLWPKQK